MCEITRTACIGDYQPSAWTQSVASVVPLAAVYLILSSCAGLPVR